MAVWRWLLRRLSRRGPPCQPLRRGVLGCSVLSVCPVSERWSTGSTEAARAVAFVRLVGAVGVGVLVCSVFMVQRLAGLVRGMLVGLWVGNGYRRSFRSMGPQRRFDFSVSPFNVPSPRHVVSQAPSCLSPRGLVRVVREVDQVHPAVHTVRRGRETWELDRAATVHADEDVCG